MSTRQRIPVEQPAESATTPQASVDRLAEIRQRASSLAEAGERAIERALSSDSDRFLESSRQRGGQ